MKRAGKPSLKHEEVANVLRRRIKEGIYERGRLLPSERLLADEFRVARPTLRRALAPLVDEGLIVASPGVGTRVASVTANDAAPREGWKILALLVPDIASPFFTEITEIVELYALQKGYQILLCSSRRQIELEEAHIRQLVERRVDGVIIAHDRYHEFAKTLTLLQGAEIPFVQMFAIPRRADFDTVVLDERSGVNQVMSYLFSLRHEHIAFCKPLPGDAPHPRLDAYLAVMKEHGHSVPDHFVVPYIVEDGDAGRSTIKRLLSASPRPTAIFAGNDSLAIVVMKQLDLLGIRVPDQLSVVGFDNLRFTEYLPVPLTTVHQPKAEIGRRAVELLLERVEKRWTGEARHETFHPHLVIRSSCAVAPAAPRKYRGAQSRH